ncbi:MipA/OmpV family protein [Jannaschia sp. W003]|uniref:MipA/OmpV family protein n=1 Tax=Jannaschia sp. W003 TaxID=2867012 RepID=UPI0021A7A5DE|nr:MipA/OmpV family protein [Jannaschia sp. W003]UWQ22766.1 MipA/OmpV family protein [Jannaschia sp. W003]
MSKTIAFAAALLALAAPAAAQDAARTGPSTQGTGGPALGFTLRGGVQSTPKYFGAESNEVGPDLGAELNYLNLGPLSFGDPDPLYRPEGFGVTGSFRFVDERSASDDAALAGLDEVDSAIELGAGVRYAAPSYEVFGAVRYGVTGHETFVGELGADVFSRPTDRLTLRAGPRALFGTDDYADTYFGVTPAESATSGLATYDPSGGLISAGVELGAGYRLSDSWGVDATVRYDVLTGDAGDSPVVLDQDQVSASIGVTRRFTFGF